MKMISWHPSINRLHLPASRCSCRSTCVQTGFKIIRSFSRPSPPPPYFVELPEVLSPFWFPSLLRTVPLLSYNGNSLSRSLALFARVLGCVHAFTPLVSCGLFCAADEERKTLLQRPIHSATFASARIIAELAGVSVIGGARDHLA